MAYGFMVEHRATAKAYTYTLCDTALILFPIFNLRHCFIYTRFEIMSMAFFQWESSKYTLSVVYLSFIRTTQIHLYAQFCHCNAEFTG